MGFYYDEQMKNPDITVRLYSWDEKLHDYDETEKGLVASAIMSDDFRVSINNSWVNNDGGDALEGMWSSLRKVGPLAKEIAKNLKPIVDDTREYDSKVFQGLSDLAKKGVGLMSSFSDLANRQLVSQTSRFVYYGGTSVNLSNMTMRYTIFYDPSTDTAVNDQVSKLFQYCMGTLDDVTLDERGNFTTNNEHINGVIDKTKQVVSDYYKWQLPPNGFKSSLRNIDTRLVGTFKMWFGNMYYMDNLVIDDVEIIMSKLRVKRVKGGNSSIIDYDATPLYADVTLSLRPAGMVLDTALRRYIRSLTPKNGSIMGGISK